MNSRCSWTLQEASNNLGAEGTNEEHNLVKILYIVRFVAGSSLRQKALQHVDPVEPSPPINNV